MAFDAWHSKQKGWLDPLTTLTGVPDLPSRRYQTGQQASGRQLVGCERAAPWLAGRSNGGDDGSNRVRRSLGDQARHLVNGRLTDGRGRQTRDGRRCWWDGGRTAVAA